MKRIPLLIVVILVCFVASTHGLDFLDFGSKKTKKTNGSLRGESDIKAPEVKSSEAATADASQVTFLEQPKTESAATASSPEKKETGVLEELSVDKKEAHKGKKNKKSAESEAAAEGASKVEFIDVSNSGDKKEKTVKVETKKSEEGTADLLDLNVASSSSAGKSKTSETESNALQSHKSKKTKKNKEKESEKEAEIVDLSSSAAGVSEKKPATDANKDAKNVNFVDLNANASADAPKKESTSDKSEKVAFVDLSSSEAKDQKKTENAEATKATTEKVEFVDVSGTEAKKAEAPTTATKQQVEFVDMSGAEKKKPAETTASETKNEKVEFVDVTNAGNIDSNKKQETTASTESKVSGKVDFVDLNENKNEKVKPSDSKAADAKSTSSAEKVEFVDVTGIEKKQLEGPSTTTVEKKNDQVEFVDVSGNDAKKKKNTKSANLAGDSKKTSNVDEVQFLETDASKKDKKSSAASDTVELLDTAASKTATKDSKVEATAAKTEANASPVVLITGITSGIGAEIAKQLVATASAGPSSGAAKIYGLVRNENTATATNSILQSVLPSITLTVGDINDSIRMLDVISEIKPTIIYHLAGRENDYSSAYNNPQSTLQLHIQGTLNLLEALKRNELFATKFFYAGSSSEYGFASDSFNCDPIPETTKLDPRSVFGLSKSTAELLALQYNKNFDIPVYVGRFFTVVGSGESADMSQYAKDLISTELGQKETPLEMVNPNVVRDVIDVRDAASAVIAIVNKGKIGDAYNIGSGKAMTTKSLIVEMAALSKKTSGLKAKSITRSVKEKDCDKCAVADISRLSLTGYSPKYTVKDTLSELMNSWRQQLEGRQSVATEK